uniref:Defective in cullin neddylation protein n=1 Tax=Ditylenchus dipsaci TaxID=166011 RepID=A0A915DIX3_9BILA
MSLQSHSLNPLLYRKEGKQSKAVGTCEVREVDVVYELWKVLRVKDVSPKYFVQNALGFFQVSNEVQLEAACYRFGRNFIPDLLTNCSECRMRLHAIEKFVEYEGLLNQQSLLAMLLRPFKVVLKKFQEESAVDAQKQLTTSQNLELINCYLIEYKQKVDKTHNFFKEVLQFVATNPRGEIPLQLVKTIWNRFLLGINSATSPDDEFPLWTELYVELINILGNYFNVLCDRRQLFIEDRDVSPTVSDFPQSGSVFFEARTHNDFQSLISSQAPSVDHAVKEKNLPTFFICF